MAKHASPQKGFALDLIITIAAGLALAFFLRIFVIETYYVPSGSMLNTIQLGDQLIGEKITYYMGAPKSGDVITFISPQDSKTVLVKRVIATAGQTLDMKDGTLYIDGVSQTEAYTEGKPTQPLPTQAAGVSISYPYTVPEGHIWVMGDNRTNSADSRYFGPVPISSVTSKVICIYWPLTDLKVL